MTDDIRVPEFSIKAGEAAIRFERQSPFNDFWLIRIPNHLGVEETWRTRGTFDQARDVGGQLAVVLDHAEAAYGRAQAELADSINDILVSARDAS